jgi:hypothetical protein
MAPAAFSNLRQLSVMAMQCKQKTASGKRHPKGDGVALRPSAAKETGDGDGTVA